MSFLAALDYHYSAANAPTEAFEIEYLLDSWGEIFPPFEGDREHSTAARFILYDYPFKLFSSTTPYEGPLPHKLTVTFRAPHQVRHQSERNVVSGIFPDEIARGFAAFLSLVTRRRVFPNRLTRQDGLPVFLERQTPPIVTLHEGQPLKEVAPGAIEGLLRQLQSMDRSTAQSFVLAMSLYHAAVEFMTTRAEFAYLLLVTALEAIASSAFPAFEHPKEDDFLASRYPGWKELADSADQEQRLRTLLLRNEHFTFAKLSAFVETHLPDRFWCEEIDDAKPQRLSSCVAIGLNGEPREHIGRTSGKIQDWEKIDRTTISTVLRRIYNARSGLVHKGISFPASIVLGLSDRVPAEAIMDMLNLAQAEESVRIPTVFTFERLVI